MHKMPTDFPIWYATIEVGQEVKVASRWEGVANAIANPNAEEVEAFIRMALKTRQLPEQTVADQIIENIRTGDTTFGTDAAAREIQILAASALAARLNPSGIAALALTTAGLDGARKPDLPMDLIGMAENAVRQKAKATRARTDIKPVVSVKSEWSFSEEQAAASTSLAMMQDLQTSINKALDLSTRQFNEAVQQIDRQHELVDEELQMLWWLTGGQTLSGETVAELKPHVRPLTVGDELATRTVRRPGPLAISALLSRAGLPRKARIKVVEAVNAMDDAWCLKIMGTYKVSPVTHPIHEAIRRRNETGAGPDWVKNWAAVCEIPEGHSLSPLRLGELFYRERLLLTVPA